MYVTVSFITSVMMKTCVSAAVWNNARVLSFLFFSRRGIFIAAIIQTRGAAVCAYVYRRGRYGAWEVIRNCLYINQHHIMKINTQLHKTSALIRNATCREVENFKMDCNRGEKRNPSKVKSALIKFRPSPHFAWKICKIGRASCRERV